MVKTQDLIPIEDIRDNLVFLKNGSISLLITTTAVNFALLFETEQYAIIQAFAALLNSLSFPIQIVIRSKRMDVTSYLDTLDKAIEKQTNPLLTEMTKRYKAYVESLIKENNVLDKKFYVCITASSIELGLFSKITPEKIQKAITLLAPRRDHMLRQLSRIGLKARQMETKELVSLFYDIYNPSYDTISDTQELHFQKPKPKPTTDAVVNETVSDSQPSAENISDEIPAYTNTLDIPQEETFQQPFLEVATDKTALENESNSKNPINNLPGIKKIASPFVVEELIDDIWPKSPNS